jgi:hypothetical protein
VHLAHFPSSTTWCPARRVPSSKVALSVSGHLGMKSGSGGGFSVKPSPNSHLAASMLANLFTRLAAKPSVMPMLSGDILSALAVVAAAPAAASAIAFVIKRSIGISPATIRAAVRCAGVRWMMGCSNLKNSFHVSPCFPLISLLFASSVVAAPFYQHKQHQDKLGPAPYTCGAPGQSPMFPR